MTKQVDYIIIPFYHNELAGVTSDANIPFDDLCHFLQRIGFQQRVRDTHYIFRREGVEKKINLQRGDGSLLCDT